MRQIDLNWIEIDGFKSFQKVCKFTPSAHPGLKLLGGDNVAEPRLEGNGAGKTSLWDALVWCLYGVTAKGNRTSGVLNWKKKQVTVTVCLHMEGEDVEITRQGPPERVFIGKDLASQDDINTIVGLSRSRFLNSVVFGQGAPLFIDLSIPARGEILEDVLDLQLWQRLSNRADDYSKTLSKELSALASQIARLEGTLAALEDEGELQRKSDLWFTQKTAEFDDLLAEFEEKEKSLALVDTPTLDKSIAEAEQAQAAQDAVVREIVSNMGSLGGTANILAQQIKALTREIENVNVDTVCRTCGQLITRENEHKHLEALRVSREALHDQYNRSAAQYEKLRKKEEDARKEGRHLANITQDFRRQRDAIQRDNKVQQDQLDALEKRIEQVAKERDANPFAARLVVVQRDKAATNSALLKTRGNQQTLQGRIHVADFWEAGFKRVRLFLIKQALSTLELEVNSAASVLGLPDWQISFKTESETKSGTIKFGVQIEVKSPQAVAAWELWSGGEAQRIRLAVAIGLSNMIQRMGGVAWTTEVWDEPSNWLSPQGIEDLLECLKYRAGITSKSIWLLDHRALTYSGFSEHWEVRKLPDTGSIVTCLGVVE